MSTEAEAQVAEETTETSDFAATLAAAMERADAAPVAEPAEEAVEEQEEQAQEETPAVEAAVVEAPKEEPKPAAPSLSQEWLSEAIRLNVPREVLRFAKNDDDVREMIVDFGDEPATEAPKAAEFPIAADDFDATDPIHKAMKVVWDQNQQLQGVIDKLTQSTTGLITERQQREVLEREAEYDAGLDALNMPELGPRGSQIRKDAWGVYAYLIQSSPGVSKAELAKRAVFAAHPELLTQQATQKQLEAIKGQEQRTLGAGPAKPPAQRQPTAHDNFLATLEAANRRAMKRMQEAG